ncbi:myelin-associated glycoprotein isoform 1-T2 [Menidia menidia]
MDKQRNMITFCLLMAAISSTLSTGEWKASVVQNLEALVTSCVVVPCSFSHPDGILSKSQLRGIWHVSDKRDNIVYHEDQTRILDKFKGRTKLLGRLDENNCTLELTEVKDHDTGPYCFRIEYAKTNEPTKQKFSFIEDCVHFQMTYDPPKPELSSSKKPIQGKPFTVTCSVQHTCPSHVPKLTWSKGSTPDDVFEKEIDMKHGMWRTESVLTFIPEENDDHTDLSCTAEFFGGTKSAATIPLHIKRTQNYNHIIIPVSVAAGTAAIFGLLCIVMMKKYKNRIVELQRRDGSVFNRISRMSRRFRSDDRGPANERLSMWSRFSKRPRRDVPDPREKPSHLNSKSCGEQKVSKPRLPSPKSQLKAYNYNEDCDGDDYVNTADLNVYGNI